MKTMMKGLLVAAPVLLMAMFAFSIWDTAMAQTTTAPPDTNVTIPYGDWVGVALNYAFEIALTGVTVLVGFLLTKLPAGVSNIVTPERVNQLLEKALLYAFNTTAEAVKGKTLTVEVTNEILRKALQYAVDHAPDLVKWAGGPELVQQKLVARLGEITATKEGEKGTAAGNLDPKAADSLAVTTAVTPPPPESKAG